MPASLIAGFDKCFAAAWLDHKHVVLGTKDNALVVMDVDARSCERVALPARREYRPAEQRRHPRRFATRNADFYVGDVLTRRDSNPGGHALMAWSKTISGQRRAITLDVVDWRRLPARRCRSFSSSSSRRTRAWLYRCPIHW